MIINFIKKKMNPLTNKEKKLHEKTKNLPHLWKKFEEKYAKEKKYQKVIAIIQVNTNLLDIAYVT